MSKPIYFVATMSAGKSTLINSLLGIDIMPSSNIACTGKIINYINKNEPTYTIEVFNNDDNIIRKFEEIEEVNLVLNTIEKYNSSEEVKLINVYGRIPFLKINDKLKFVDLPGPNNSNNITHGEISYKVIENIKSGLIVYVMDGTSLSSNDSSEILKLIAKKIENTKIEVLFVINKTDYFESMDELKGIILEAEKLIKKNGIEKAEIYPVSSLAALSFSEYLSENKNTDLAYMLDGEYYKELAFIKKYKEDITLDKKTRNEQLPFFNTGIVNLKKAIKKSIFQKEKIPDLYIEYNPYTLETKLEVNGNKPKETSFFHTIKNGIRMQEWVEELPGKTLKELDENKINIKFKGIKMDFEDLKFVCDKYENATFNLEHIPGKEIDSKEKLLRNIFEEMSKGPVEEFKGEKTNRIFENVLSNILEVNALATMSSGKSTVINALLDREILPSENKACTALIFKIIDNDKDKFKVSVKDRDGNEIQTYSETYKSTQILEILADLNKLDYIIENNIETVELYGNIPFVKSDEEQLVLVDTPGPNNANNEDHGMVTQKMIESSNKDLILYIMDGTTLSSNDSNDFLELISKSMKEGGLQSRDRFIFVLNKMDNLKEGESLEGIIEEARKLLKRHDIENPIIIPVSGLAALKLRKYLEGENNKDSQTMDYMMEKGVFEELSLIHKFNNRIHLEEYVNLSGESNKKIKNELEEAKVNGNIVDQAIIHTGIRSLEEAVSVYLNKYFKTAKIKNTSEAIEGYIKSIGIENKLNQNITNTEESRDLAKINIDKVKKELESGKKTEKLYDEINAINLKKDFRELGKNTTTDFDKWLIKYTDENRGKKLEKNKAEKEIFKIQKIIDKKLRSYFIMMEKQIETILINENKEFIDKYRKYLKDISKELSFDLVDFNMEGVLEGNITSIENRAMKEIIDRNTYREEVVVGVERRYRDGKWYKPWTLGLEPKYYNVDIIEYKEFVKLEDVLSDIFISIEQTFTENIKNGEKEAIYRQETLKFIYQESLKELENKLNEKLEDYGKLIKKLGKIDKELYELDRLASFIDIINLRVLELQEL